MADKERDAQLRKMALHRGFKLVKSRRRKPGGDFGRYGLKTASSGDECLGFGKKGLTATVDEIEAFLRQQTASTWAQSLGSAEPAKPATNAERGPRNAANRRAPPPTLKPASTAKVSIKPKPAPKLSLRIREADSVDAEALARLVSSYAPAEADEVAERLALLARAGERPFVAQLGDQMVGLITWHVTPVLHRARPVGRITYLEVDEKVRRQGIGRQLVETVEERLQERGCGSIEVTSNVRLAGAHKFYRALKFERTSHRFGKVLGTPDKQ